MTEEWVKKMWYIYTMEFYSAIKKNEMMLFTGKLENNMLREVRQTQKVKSCIFSHIHGSYTYKLNVCVCVYMYTS
jgi:hypothetical protein